MGFSHNVRCAGRRFFCEDINKFLELTFSAAQRIEDGVQVTVRDCKVFHGVPSFLSVGCGSSVMRPQGVASPYPALAAPEIICQEPPQAVHLTLDRLAPVWPSRPQAAYSFPAPAGAQLPPRRAQPAPQAGRSAARSTRFPEGVCTPGSSRRMQFFG